MGWYDRKVRQVRDLSCGDVRILLELEVRRIRYVRNRPVIEFVPKRRAARVECLDALCYAWAVRQAPAVKSIDMRTRAARKPQPGTEPPLVKSAAASWASHFNE